MQLTSHTLHSENINGCKLSKICLSLATTSEHMHILLPSYFILGHIPNRRLYKSAPEDTNKDFHSIINYTDKNQYKLHEGIWKRPIRKQLMMTIAGTGRRTKGRKQKEFLFTIPHPPPSSSSSLWSLLPVSTATRAPGQDFSVLQFPTISGPILLFRAQPSALSAWRLLKLSTKPHSGIQKHPEYILSWFSHHWSPWILEHNLSTIWSSFYVVPADSGILLALWKLLPPSWAVLPTMTSTTRGQVSTWLAQS